MMREIVGGKAEIKKDPLHARYAVNKFGIHVEGDIEALQDAYDRFLALLMISGYILNHRNGETLVTQNRNSVVVCVYAPQRRFESSEAIIRIGVN